MVLFPPIHLINNEAVEVWDTLRELYHTCNCNTTKQVWDTLKKIHEVPTKIERGRLMRLRKCDTKYK